MLSASFSVFALSVARLLFTEGQEQRFSPERHLEIAKQPSLAKLQEAKADGYRFIMYDAGYTSSLSVLVQKSSEGAVLSAADVSLHDYYGSDGQRGVQRSTKQLSPDEWAALSAKLKRLDLWNYRPSGKAGLDGSSWVLEVVQGGKSRRITEWSPDIGDYRAACLLLWRMSGQFTGNYEKVER
jgi:hypothetical protein